MDKISVIMPVKNTALYLAECLDSLLTQTYKHWELIAIDDHSDDDSAQILNQYSRLDDRISTYSNNGRGIIDALQTGYQYSSGQFIHRMDSDDVMSKDKLQLLYEATKIDQESTIAIGLVSYFSAQPLGQGYKKYADWLNRLTSSGTNFKDIYKECTIPSPCWMVSRTVFEKAGGFTHKIYPEDYDLAFRFKALGLRVQPVLKEIHYWRDYNTRTSRTNEHYSDNRFTDLKVHHFLRQDKDVNASLILWGAGKKGKQIAKNLNKNNVDFIWACNNPQKIGHNIYGTILKDLSVFSDFEGAQILVAVSSPQEENYIRSIITSYDHHQFYHFS